MISRAESVTSNCPEHFLDCVLVNALTSENIIGFKKCTANVIPCKQTSEWARIYPQHFTEIMLIECFHLNFLLVTNMLLLIQGKVGRIKLLNVIKF